MSKWVDRQRKEREDAERLLRETAPKVPTCSTSPTEWNFEAAGYVGQEAAEKAAESTEPDPKLGGLRFKTDDWVVQANDQNGRTLAEKAVEAIDAVLQPAEPEPVARIEDSPRFVHRVGLTKNPKGAN